MARSPSLAQRASNTTTLLSPLPVVGRRLRRLGRKLALAARLGSWRVRENGRNYIYIYIYIYIFFFLVPILCLFLTTLGLATGAAVGRFGKLVVSHVSAPYLCSMIVYRKINKMSCVYVCVCSRVIAGFPIDRGPESDPTPPPRAVPRLHRYSYPAILVHPHTGLVHVAYTYRKRYIKHVIFDVGWATAVGGRRGGGGGEGEGESTTTVDKKSSGRRGGLSSSRDPGWRG